MQVQDDFQHAGLHPLDEVRQTLRHPFGDADGFADRVEYHPSAWPLRVQDDLSSSPDVLMDVPEYPVSEKEASRTLANSFRYRVLPIRVLSLPAR